VKENSHQFEHFVMAGVRFAARAKLQLTNRPPAPSFRAKSIPTAAARVQKLEASLPS
jgi:hypothetical protein